MAEPMMSSDLSRQEIYAFVDDLIAATNSGAARWQESSDSSDFFFLETRGGTVNVESMAAGGHPFVFRIFDDTGRKMYELHTEIAPFYSPEEERLAELYAAARNSVYDVSGTVLKIRRALGLP